MKQNNIYLAQAMILHLSKIIVIFIFLFLTLVISIFFNLKLAKCSLLYKNPIRSIIYFKEAKRAADSRPLLEFKMKAYKGLGRSLLLINLYYSKLYFTKYLMCAWVLNDHNQELKAYDYLGMYWYYQGNLYEANLFHEKSLNGEFEKDDSNLKQLGVSRLLNGSIGKAKKINKYQVNSDENKFEISSDEDPFELQVKRQTKCLMKKPKLQEYQLRSIPKCNVDFEKRKKIFKRANEYIRKDKLTFNSNIMEGDQVDLKKLKGISHKSKLFGKRNERIHIQHLSPNRNLEMFQSLEINKLPGDMEQTQKLVPFYERKDMQKIQKVLSSLHFETKFIISWIQLRQLKIGVNQEQKRKGYLIY